MAFEKITEEASYYRHLEKMSVAELLTNINKEDQTVRMRWQKQFRKLKNWWKQSVIKC